MNILERYNHKHLDSAWDNQVFTYDLDKHNWPAWALDCVQQVKPKVERLQDIHLHFNTHELIGLRKHFERATNSSEFSTKLDNFIAEYFAPEGDYVVQATSGIRLVVPDQGTKGRLLNFHTGHWTGYDNGMNTIWTPLSPVYGTNSMQVIDWDTSIDLMNKIHTEEWSLEQIQSECEAVAKPVEIEVGQSWMFNQGHLHGNVNNTTGISRVSFDARVAGKEVNFGTRRVGSFFRFPGTNAVIENVDTDRNWLVFVDPNSDYIGSTPHFIIREFLLQFCDKLGIKPIEWSNEYWHCTWMPKLQNYINHPSIGGIVMPSIQSLTCDIHKSLEWYTLAVQQGKHLIFADENILVDSIETLETISKIANFRQTN